MTCQICGRGRSLHGSDLVASPARDFAGTYLMEAGCKDGVWMDDDVYHEGWERDTSYPVCPCSPKRCGTCARPLVTADGIVLAGHVSGPVREVAERLLHAEQAKGEDCGLDTLRAAMVLASQQIGVPAPLSFGDLCTLSYGTAIADDDCPECHGNGWKDGRWEHPHEGEDVDESEPTVFVDRVAEYIAPSVEAASTATIGDETWRTWGVRPDQEHPTIGRLAEQRHAAVFDEIKTMLDASLERTMRPDFGMALGDLMKEKPSQEFIDAWIRERVAELQWLKDTGRLVDFSYVAHRDVGKIDITFVPVKLLEEIRGPIPVQIIGVDNPDLDDVWPAQPPNVIGGDDLTEDQAIGRELHDVYWRRNSKPRGEIEGLYGSSRYLRSVNSPASDLCSYSGWTPESSRADWPLRHKVMALRVVDEDYRFRDWQRLDIRAWHQRVDARKLRKKRTGSMWG
jgi:hypothetical protein